MYRKVIALCLTVFLVSLVIAAHAEEISLKREVSERFIVQIDFPFRGTKVFQSKP
jgi:hypothetical protein